MRMDSENVNSVLSLLKIMEKNEKRMMRLGLCYLLKCEGIQEFTTKSNLGEFFQNLNGTEVYSELLLISVHFHMNESGKVIDYIRSVLDDLSIPEQQESFNKISDLIKDLMPEQTIAKLLPVTEQRLINTSSFKCMYNLLKKGVFMANKVQVGSWVFEQIRIAKEPLQALFPSLIEEFIFSGIYNKYWEMDRFDDNMIKQILNGKSMISKANKNKKNSNKKKKFNHPLLTLFIFSTDFDVLLCSASESIPQR